MSRSSRKKEKYGITSEFSHDDGSKGTAARTRPFSFDEIMLQRKNKKQLGDVEEVLKSRKQPGDVEEVRKNRKQPADAEEVPGVAGSLYPKSVVEKVSDHVGSDRYRHNDFVATDVKNASEDFVKASSKKKEDNSSIKEGKLVKDRDKEIRDSKSKSKVTPSKSSKGGKIDKWVHGRRKNDGGSSDEFKNEPEKRHKREFVAKDRYADRNRGKIEKESKRKDRNDDDERIRERNAGKKHDSWKRHDLDFSERKGRKESSQFRHEDSRQKRRRSRSREHKDKGKRSISLSPKSHKRTSHDVRDHVELSSHSFKERSEKLQSDVDRKMISNDDSSAQYRRHGVPANRLGGYSPRKRRTEAAIKTPSPTSRSPEKPEKKSAGWDLPPVGKERNFTDSVLTNLESSKQTVSTKTHELLNVRPVTSNTPTPAAGVVFSAPSLKMNASVDSIQLTQATRPMRRLYVENLPASATDEAVMQCLNNFLLSSGVNLIQGTKPCISCVINKEKRQALAEFLTPEDATTALSFDGRSFSGSILKIRRPKDFVEVTVRMTGVPEKSLDVVESVSNIVQDVQDCHHKIFIGGISKVISSEMLMEIASAFGPLKAYRFDINADRNEPCAFLEYVDQSVTPKACSGLNGLILGGQVLTVVQVIPDASSSMENIGNSPSYEIPDHAKPLLEKPTEVLTLKNLLDPDSLSSMSEQELEEILEDIRLECARFGTVKSVNIIKPSKRSTTPEACEVTDSTRSIINGHNLDQVTDSARVSTTDPSNTAKQLQEINTDVEGKISCDDKLTSSRSEPSSSTVREPEEANKETKDEICDPALVDTLEICEKLNTLMEQSETRDQKVADVTQIDDLEMEDTAAVKEELKSEDDNEKLDVASSETDLRVKTELEDDLTKGEDKVSDVGDVLEPGCVLVEYRRAEASSKAAHCLHGRLFNGRVVTVGYFALDLYRARFLK